MANTAHVRLWQIALLLSALASADAQVQAPSLQVFVPQTNSTTKTLSAATANPGLAAFKLFLNRTDVHATIADGIARTTVTQKFQHMGTVCLAAKYVFPLAPDSEVDSVSVRVGLRVIKSEIRLKPETFPTGSFTDFSTTSSLQIEPRKFVAAWISNIRPGEIIETIVKYIEELVPVGGVYAMNVPAMQGPTYGNHVTTWTNHSDLTTHTSFLLLGGVEGHTLSNNTTLSKVSNPEGLRLQGVRKSNESHPVGIQFWFTTDQIKLRFHRTDFEDFGGWSGEMFQLTIHPPLRKSLNPYHVLRHEYVFILDMSNSQTTWPIDMVSELIYSLGTDGEHRGDSLNIILFNRGTGIFSHEGSKVATPEYTEEAIQWLRRHRHLQPVRMELLSALARAYKEPMVTHNSASARTVVLMTDGYITVESEVHDMIRQNLGKTSFFVMGVGEKIHSPVVEGLAQSAFSRPVFATNAVEGQIAIKQMHDMIDLPVLGNIKLAIEGGTGLGNFQPYLTEPPMGNIPWAAVGRPVRIIGRYTTPKKEVATGILSVSGATPGGDRWTQRIDLAAHKAGNAEALPLNWAKTKIDLLNSYPSKNTYGTDVHQDKITKLAARYNLQTQYTTLAMKTSNFEKTGSSQAACAALASSVGTSETGTAWLSHTSLDMETALGGHYVAPLADV